MGAKVGEQACFDYIVVGAGTAGCVLANRLCASGATVCVLEAGPSDWHPFIHLPAGYVKTIYNKSLTWDFNVEPGPVVDRSFALPQGRVLGGSSSINGLSHVRGQQADYDSWAAAGNPGWSYAEVLPYFMRSERRIGPGDEHFRGRRGELPVTDPDWLLSVCENFIDGLQELGIERTPDYNGATHAGSGYFQRAIHGGYRWSSAKAFLRPLRGNANLDIRTHAQATRILFEGRRAVGVEYRRGGVHGQPAVVRARREVILSAGAINSPRLLQLSGVGPREVIQDVGLPMVHELPGVGRNLRDHYRVRMVARLRGVRSINQIVRGPGLVREAVKWLFKKPCPFGVSASLVHVFCKSSPSVERPDIEGVFSPASFRDGVIGVLDDYPGATLGIWQGRPESHGEIRLRSANPFEAPLVQPNYLSDERDRRVLIDGMRLGRQMLASRAMAPYFDGETVPGPDCQTDDEFLDFARETGATVYHLVGTCRMGPAGQPGSVVDPALRVHGLDGLRVVDASIMPTLPSVNTNASALMIGEKGADLVLGRSLRPVDALPAVPVQ
ncbi:MAG: GMC family oxidoreductase N-terminal domain-containing protein [Lautropia sp.]|nr:GMC family oxidoreductase N-terminal domain-containing protein [Lautropia sp.]